jgi:hypothetical protein
VVKKDRSIDAKCTQHAETFKVCGAKSSEPKADLPQFDDEPAINQMLRGI